MPIHILTLHCPDQPGIVAAITQTLFERGANILDNAQFGDVPSGEFCMRTRFESADEDAAEIATALRMAAARFAPTLDVRREDEPPRLLLMVSKLDHCLVDILQRWHAGELPVDISLIVSNHADLATLAASYGIDFEHIAVTADTKAHAEQRLRAAVQARSIDLIVLARYMQVLSPELTREFNGRVINIHHSFLPGFKGAKPYHQAWDRGVKLIGATAHFVTDELDEGPIIDQDVHRVSHADTPDTMRIIGKDIERTVLSRAVKAWAEGRVFLLGHRTVVFA